MLTVNLDAQLSGHVFAFLMIFTRLGAAVMLFPGIGEAYVTPRIRLLFALALSFLLMPVLAPLIPRMPESMPSLVVFIAQEALIGIFVGSLLRLLIAAIETAGAIIAVQVGLSNAMVLNPSQATQSALPSAFLGAAGITLLFITGLDHLMLRGLLRMYELFPAGGGVMVGDMAQAYVKMLAKSFLVGVEIGAPFLVIGLLLFTALGFMQRMVAQVQLFLVALPVQIVAGMTLFAATMGMIMTVWLRYFDASMSGFMVE